ncbi:MAG: hypothetical protein IKA06_01675 [Clostridia bacterium]|nr:hypothetical protein [Clostridia bacterium]
MRKKEYNLPKTKFNLSRPARIILLCGALLTLLNLLGILHTVMAHAPLTEAAAVYYGGMLEYPIAALMITIGGAALADIAYKRDHP